MHQFCVLAILLTFIAFTQGSYYFVGVSQQNATCESTLVDGSSNGMVTFFNGCLMDDSDLGILGALGAQIMEWFNQALYLQYLTSFLFFLPFVAFNEKRELETQAKANRLRCFLVLLVFRLGLAAAVSSWFQALFQQPRPCDCYYNGSVTPQQIGSVWGMPSADMVVTTILALFFMQYISKLVGIALIITVAYSRVILGYDSVGQVLAAMIIGLVLHIYQIGSPIFMRLLDYVVNIIGGLATFILVKRGHPDVDFTFAVLFLNGIAWMTYSIAVFILYYDFNLLKEIWNIPSHFLTDESFLYYTPRHEGSLGSIGIAPQRKHEILYFVILTLLLFATLVGIRVYAPYINETLNGIWGNN